MRLRRIDLHIRVCADQWRKIFLWLCLDAADRPGRPTVRSAFGFRIRGIQKKTILVEVSMRSLRPNNRQNDNGLAERYKILRMPLRFCEQRGPFKNMGRA